MELGLPGLRDRRSRSRRRSPCGWPRPAAARWYALVVIGYVASFVLLSLALDEGMGIGVAYGIWTAVGVAFTAVLSKRPLRRTPHPHDGLRHRS